MLFQQPEKTVVNLYNTNGTFSSLGGHFVTCIYNRSVSLSVYSMIHKNESLKVEELMGVRSTTRKLGDKDSGDFMISFMYSGSTMEIGFSRLSPLHI